MNYIWKKPSLSISVDGTMLGKTLQDSMQITTKIKNAFVCEYVHICAHGCVSV